MPYPKPFLNQVFLKLENCTMQETPSIALQIIFPNLYAISRKLNTSRYQDPLEKAQFHFVKNEFQKLTNVLNSSPLTTINEDTISSLHQLFPNEPSTERILVNTTLQEISYQELMDELNLMCKRRRAPGLSGITPQHLHHLCKTSRSIGIALSVLTNKILQGETDDVVNADYLKITKLAPLRKSNGGIRPIGVNETLLNLCSRIALRQCTEMISSYLHNLDFGFNRKGATEAVSHCIMFTWSHLEKNAKRFIIIKFDFTNAYNSLLRSKIFQVVHQYCPQLLPFLYFRYQGVKFKFPTMLDNDLIECNSGVCQGCPLSPAIFQLVMSDLLRPIREQFPFPITSFQDDVKAIVPDDFNTINDLYSTLKKRAAEFGLILNSKSAIFSDQPISSEEINDFPFLNEIKIAENGIDVLGTNIGSQRFIEDCLAEDLSVAKAKMDRFLNFLPYSINIDQDHQWKHKTVQYIKWSHASLPVHRLRTTHPSLSHTFAEKHDLLIANTLMKALLSDHDPSTVPHPIQEFLDSIQNPHRLEDNAYMYCTYKRIFLKRGGLGVYSAFHSHQAAYLGSIALSFPIVSDFLLAYYPGVENIAALKNLNAIKIELETEYDIKIDKIYDNSPIMKLQEHVYKQIQKSLHFTIADEILNKLPEVTFARFVSRSQPIATAFLHVPLSGFIKLNDQEYEDNLLLTIGLPPVMGNLCAICNSSLGSSYEDHSVSKCSKFTHKRYGSMLEKGVRMGLSEIFENPSSNEIILENLPQWTSKNPGQPRHRGDIITDHCGKTKILDVSGTTKFTNYRSTFYKEFPAFPRSSRISTKSSLHSLKTSIQESDNRTVLDFFSGLSASKREVEKHKFYSKRFFFPENSLIAAGIESHGGIGKEFNNYLMEAKKHLKQIQHIIPNNNQRSLFRKCIDLISLHVCKANTILFNNIRYGYYHRQRRDMEET